MRKIRKRKKINFKVKREFQKWLLVRTGAAILLSSIVSAFMFFLYLEVIPTESNLFQLIWHAGVSSLFIPVFIAGTAVSFLSGVLLVISLPVKIAGPIYRIERELKAIQDGNLSKTVELRNEDILKDLASTVNTTVFSLRDKIIRFRRSLDLLDESLKKGNLGSARETMKRAYEDIDKFYV